MVFILPTLVGLIVFRLGPIISAFYISFTEWNIIGDMKFVGVKNYIYLFHDPIFIKVLLNTVHFALLYVPGVLVLGLGMALLVNQKIFAATFFRGVYFLPYITATVAVTLTWKWIFSTRYGLLNYFLESLGVSNPPAWLADSHYALSSVALVSVWKDSGFYMLIFLAGLQTIDQDCLKAAKMDGASMWNRLRYVILPLLLPSTFFVIILAIVRSSQSFDVTYALTAGGPNRSSTTLAYYIYENAFVHFEMGTASALAYILCVMVGTATLISHWLKRKYNYADNT